LYIHVSIYYNDKTLYGLEREKSRIAKAQHRIAEEEQGKGHMQNTGADVYRK